LEHLWSPWRMTYIKNSQKNKECIFCHQFALEDGPQNLIVYRGDRAFIILNRYPYTSGHLMVAPDQHMAGLSDLDDQTRLELLNLTAKAVEVLTAEYHPDGFNLGINLGEVAGAGIIDHVHLHIVPRWGGDTNFMSTTAATRVLPESLEDTYWRIRRRWEDGTNQSQT
jgi:ATP adenylyltransferase